jgi:proteasome lid subunit RPN8/RPN11
MTSASPYSEPGDERAAALPGSDWDGRSVAPELAGLPEEVSPLAPGSYRLHGERPPSGTPLVLISQVALQQVETHGRSNLETELGGALLGYVYRSGNETFVEIVAALPAASHDHGPVHFTFTADAWSQLHREREHHYPELTIVGWFHTHPDLGVFFSADDVVVHSAAFVLPWHVALVVDPVRGEGCFFGWQTETAEREIVPLPGFFELLDEAPETTLAWRLTPRPYWQESGRGASRQRGRVVLPETEWPALPPISPWWGALMGGVGLLISLILLLERLLQR